MSCDYRNTLRITRAHSPVHMRALARTHARLLVHTHLVLDEIFCYGIQDPCHPSLCSFRLGFCLKFIFFTLHVRDKLVEQNGDDD